jgi:hypothetical protein
MAVTPMFCDNSIISQVWWFDQREREKNYTVPYQVDAELAQEFGI